VKEILSFTVKPGRNTLDLGVELMPIDSSTPK